MFQFYMTELFCRFLESVDCPNTVLKTKSRQLRDIMYLIQLIYNNDRKISNNRF